MRPSILCPISISVFLIVVLSIAPSFCIAIDSPSLSNQAATQRQLLATTYQNEVMVNEYWVSEKLDGIRARWNGNTLLTRNGKSIYAPTWFIKDFPPRILDGELWVARNRFEKTASIVLRKTPNEGWHNIKFMLFDLPEHAGTFSHRLAKLHDLVGAMNSHHLQVIPHFKLANQNQLMDRLDKVVALGAEGLMLHHQDAYYQNGRSNKLLKLKKHQDAEATVIAHFPGKGKYQNMLGSLLVEFGNGLQFKIGTGLSEKQRKTPPAIGTVITFKYYGLTAKGIPRFASFLRIKPTEKKSVDERAITSI